MEPHQIKSFVTVARTGNLTRAARILNTTPPSVSTHIRQLEALFGLTLFSRTPRGMVLTVQGEALVPKAQAVLEALEALALAAQDQGGQVRGNLRLGINADPGFLRIEPMVHRLFENHPGLTLEVVFSNTGEILDQVAKGGLDLGFAFGCHKVPGLAFQDLSRVDLDIVLPVDFGQALKDANWETLAGLPWIVPQTPCPFLDLVKGVLAGRNLELTRPVTANDDITKTALINRGVAATVLLRSEAKQMAADGRVFIWEGQPGLSTRISLVYPALRAGCPKIRTLARTVAALWQDPGD